MAGAPSANARFPYSGPRAGEGSNGRVRSRPIRARVRALAPGSLRENNEQEQQKRGQSDKGENAMDLGLQDKHAIVTGGSRGLCKAIARGLGPQRARVSAH